MHRIPYFPPSLPRLHRQHQPETPEIVDGFGNHEGALRTAEGEFVGVAPAASPFLAEGFFAGGGVCGIGFVVPDAAPLHDVAALVPGAVAGDTFGIGVDRGDGVGTTVVAVPAVVFVPPVSPRVDQAFRAACGLFPFGFVGQAASRPPGVGFRVVPVDEHDRVIIELFGTAVFVPDRKRVDPCTDVGRPMARSLHERPVLAVGDGIDRNVKRFKRDGALRTLPVEAVAHGETACGNKHHRGSVTLVDDDRRQFAARRTERESSEFGKDVVMVKCVHFSLLWAPLKTYCAFRLLRWAVLKILMYSVYTPVSALRPPCSRSAHDTFLRCPYFCDEAKAFRSSEALRACPFVTMVLSCSICS